MNKKSRRQEVLSLDQNRCLSCGGSSSLEVDHIIPRTLGGPNCWNNQQTLCQPCNQSKADRPLDFRSPERRLAAQEKCGCGWELPLVVRPFGKVQGQRQSIWENCQGVERHPDDDRGRWVFTGTWLPIAELFGSLAEGVTLEEFLDWYEGVERSVVEEVIDRQRVRLGAAKATGFMNRETHGSNHPPNPFSCNFHRWATGDLVGNANRGIYAEWLVGQALGIIRDGNHRTEWSSYDLLYCDVKIEVKASGFSQTWNPFHKSTPRFDIKRRKWAWDAEAEEERRLEPPKRPSDIYVFCLHKAVPATNQNVQDPTTWDFWVIPTRKLDRELGGQKSVGARTLDRLGHRVGWEEILEEVISLILIAGRVDPADCGNERSRSDP